jgi:hypothetical protein
LESDAAAGVESGASDGAQEAESNGSAEESTGSAEESTDSAAESTGSAAETTGSAAETTGSAAETTGSAAETASGTALESADPQLQAAPYTPLVLCRADFDIPDVHGTGYTNLIDYYNDYPDGKTGGTFANASLMVHYREDMDKDLSLADSLAFRTYRGVGLGTGREDVFAAYGEGVTEPPFPEVMGIGDAQHTVSYFVDYRAKIQSGACVGIRFYFDQNDTVMFIDYGAVYLQYAGNVSSASLYPLAG